MALLRMRFINSTGLVAEGIDFVTNSLWDHVELITETGYLGAQTGDGVQVRPFNYCTPTREMRYAIPCSAGQYSDVMTYGRSKIGTQYDYADIFGLALHDRSLNTPVREICSMFVLECAQAGGIQMLNVLPGYTHLVTPETLHLSPLLIGRSYSF